MRGIIFFTFLFCFQILQSQQNKNVPEGWDTILLDGKIAYMNLVTGDVSTTLPTKPARKPKVVEEFDPTITHQVKKGETLSTIARSNNLSLADLYRLNSLTDFDKIEVGDLIVIGYKNENNLPSETVYEKKPDTLKDGYHIVREGETLYRISVNNSIPVSRLKRLNNLVGNTIFVGQKLRLK